MTNKKPITTFSILALIVWSSSWWAYRLFRWVDYPTPYSLRPKLISAAIVIIFLLALTHIVYKIVKTKPGSRGRVVLLNIIGLGFVALYALIASTISENRWGMIFNKVYPLKTLITILPSAEGLDVIFLFFLALFSGYWFRKKDFWKLLAVWLFIISLNEMLIQRFILTYRFSTIVDVVSNMVGASVGIILSLTNKS